jgi:hypothetical protein
MSVTAWVDIDLPRRFGESQLRRRVFHGQPCHTLAAAEESAAQAVLDYLCTFENVAIDDYNYGALRGATASLAAGNEWKRTKEWQISMARQETFKTQKEYNRRMKILEKICARFMDILPFGAQASTSRSKECTIIYTGAHPPQNRIAELAYALYQFMLGADPTAKRSN